MKKYKVFIKELVSSVVEVEGDNHIDAAKNVYKNKNVKNKEALSSLILPPEEYTYHVIDINDENNSHNVFSFLNEETKTKSNPGPNHNGFFYHKS